MDNPMTTETITLDRATIYRQGGFGGDYRTLRVRDLKITREAWAQYSKAIMASFIPKGARKRRRVVETYEPTLVVVAGWDAPEAPDSYRWSAPDANGTRVGRSVHGSMFSAGFHQQFGDWLAAQDVEIVADFRGANTH